MRARSTATALGKLGIEHAKNKMVGRGVLLDIARFRGVDWLKDGEAISNDELDKCAKDENVEIRRGDFVILRTGQMERCMAEKNWGAYAGGGAPGVGSRIVTGARTNRLPPSAPTPGASKCGRTKRWKSISLGTGS